jgi:choline kinase
MSDIDNSTIGEKLSPILVEVEQVLWEIEADMLGSPKFPREALRAATKIFMAVMMDTLWETRKEYTSMKELESKVILLAKDVRELVKTYTGIDTRTLYKENE